MKNIIILFVCILYFSSCRKSEPAKIEVRFHVLPNDELDRVSVSIDVIEMHEYLGPITTSVQDVDGFFNQFVEFQGAVGISRTLFFGPQPNGVVDGIRPHINIFINDMNNEFFFVNIVNFDPTDLPEQVVIEEDFLYLIDITLDLKNVIKVDSLSYELDPQFEIEMLKR